MIPACDHTGVPLHFHSSTTSGSACLMTVRSRESVSPRQSPSSLILASINSDGDPGFCGALFFTTSLSYHIDCQGRASFGLQVGPYRPSDRTAERTRADAERDHCDHEARCTRRLDSRGGPCSYPHKVLAIELPAAGVRQLTTGGSVMRVLRSR